MFEPRRTFALASTMLAVFLLGPVARLSAQDATAYAVADAASGKVLLQKNATQKLAVGSLTNIATAMVVLDWFEQRPHDLGEMVQIPMETMAYPDNPIGFTPGDQVSLRDLLYAALMQSDDIATYTLASFVGHELPTTEEGETPIQAFVAQMNALARQKLQMRNTLFVDTTGMEMNEKRLPYSTAVDMTQLARYAMTHSQFRFYVSQKSRTIHIQHGNGTAGGYQLANTNELLGVESIDGLRTSTTHRTGPSVIISAAQAPESVQKGEQYIITPRRLIVVVLGAGDRFAVAHGLLDSGWQAYAKWAQAGRPLR